MNSLLSVRNGVRALITADGPNKRRHHLASLRISTVCRVAKKLILQLLRPARPIMLCLNEAPTLSFIALLETSQL